MSETLIIKGAKVFATREMAVIRGMISVSAIILIGVLVGLSIYGIDLRTVFFGIPEGAFHEASRGIIALEGLIVAVTLLCGSLIIAGIGAIITNRKLQPAAKESKEQGEG